MEDPYGTIKGRLTQVVYVFFATIALLAVVGGAGTAIYGASVFASSYPNDVRSEWADPLFGGLAWFGIGIAAYAFGWTFRWVLTGRTSSVLAGLGAIYRFGEASSHDNGQ